MRHPTDGLSPEDDVLLAATRIRARQRESLAELLDLYLALNTDPTDDELAAIDRAAGILDQWDQP